ncbi:putative methyltransferase DDB_G0268948 [Leptodactylus fuscus]|uniref:putative methyltransferase DDB_G0268948 n=1 Tax=Leptodactylus fuscus TaxID=238119 RepID=UPI003F4ECF3A
MAFRLFNKTTFSSIYQKDMIPASKEIVELILSYLKKKTDGQPLEMALDVGCGAGRYTIPLAPHFKKVLGTDISESIINVAKQYNSADNVSYMVAPAEKMPLKDASVDLVTAGLAAHWFNLEKFASEAIRVLKTKGCLAMHGIYPATDFVYTDMSHDLNLVMSEVWDVLHQHDDKKVTRYLFNQYQEIFEALPLKDKEWITNVPETTQMSILDIMGFIRSSYMYQTFLEEDAIKAETFFTRTEQKFLKVLGEEADSAVLNVHMKYFCVLACKS